MPNKDDMPKIMAIDTSTEVCSAALLFDDKVIDRSIVVPKKHTSFILPMIDELLAEAKLNLGQFDAFAFGNGPGSFTGVRLAASLAQGFAMGRDLPVIGVSTLRTMAQQALLEFGATKVLVAQDARMKEIYWGEYYLNQEGKMEAIKPDRLVKPQELKLSDINVSSDFVGVGGGFDIYKKLFANKIKLLPLKYVQAKYLVRLAECDFANGLAVSPEKALPVYLRLWGSGPDNRQ